MRAMIALASCLVVGLSPASGGCNEPSADSGISFALPFACHMSERIWPFTDPCKGLCLPGSFMAGIDVVLVNKTGVFNTKTSDPCTYRHLGEVVKSTQLADTDKIFAQRDNGRRLNSTIIAIIGVDPAAVRVVSPSDDRASVPKKMELKARRLALKTVPTGRECVSRVFDAYKACKSDSCFFSVNDKLYFAYDAFQGCCNCAAWECHPCVYDLSSGAPEKVYYGPARIPEESLFKSFESRQN